MRAPTRRRSGLWTLVGTGPSWAADRRMVYGIYPLPIPEPIPIKEPPQPCSPQNPGQWAQRRVCFGTTRLYECCRTRICEMPIFEITQDRLVLLQPTGFSTHGLRERADL